MPRLFTAIDPSDDVREQLRAYCDARDVPFEARWTPPANYHITLRFIGDVDDDRAEAVESVLEGVTRDAFTLEPLGLGLLPSRRNPRVLTINIGVSDPLQGLYDDVEEALAAADVDREQRSYRPHLTIARLKNADSGDVRSFLKSAPAPELSTFDIDRFILYESILKPSGAVHEPRAEFRLG